MRKNRRIHAFYNSVNSIWLYLILDWTVQVLTDTNEFADLFKEEDDIYIFKQLIGQSKRFLYLFQDEKPDNYERPSDFDDGDFQLLTMSYSNVPNHTSTFLLC